MRTWRTEAGAPDEERPFNMAVLFLERINKRLDERDLDRRTGNILGWYRSLRCIYANIYFKIVEKGNEKQEEELNDLFTKAKNFLKAAMVDTKEAEEQLKGIALSNIEFILDEIDQKIGLLMFEYDLIMPKGKTPMTYEEVIDEEYK